MYDVQLNSQCHLIPISLVCLRALYRLCLSSIFEKHSNFLLMTLSFIAFEYYSFLRRIFRITAVCAICHSPCTKHQINNNFQSLPFFQLLLLYFTNYKVLRMHETSVFDEKWTAHQNQCSVFVMSYDACFKIIIGCSFGFAYSGHY